MIIAMSLARINGTYGFNYPEMFARFSVHVIHGKMRAVMLRQICVRHPILALDALGHVGTVCDNNENPAPGNVRLSVRSVSMSHDDDRSMGMKVRVTRGRVNDNCFDACDHVWHVWVQLPGNVRSVFSVHGSERSAYAAVYAIANDVLEA